VPDRPLHHTLRRHYDALRHALLLRHALRASAGTTLVLTLAVLFGVVAPLGPLGSWARLVLVAALALAILVLALGRFLRARPGFAVYLESVEGRFPEVRSWLRNALDFDQAPPLDTSVELTQAVSAETARRLEGVPLAGLRPAIGPRGPLLAMLGALAALTLLGLLSPARTTRSWMTLWNPAAAAPPVRLVVEPGSVRITPGAALAVRARVWGSSGRPRLLRDRGPAVAAAPEGRGAEGDRVWRFDLTQLTREESYQVAVAGMASPRYRISLVGEPQPLSFEVEYRSPAYARLPVQRGASTRGDLAALRGARAQVDVTFDRDLQTLEGTLPGGGVARWKALTPRRWRGEIPLDRAGEYELHARAGTGEGRYRYRVAPLADAPPVIAVRLPEGDLDLPAGQQIPLEVIGQDDLGLSELRLQVRKDPAAPWSERTLARFPDQPREARVAQAWDASSLALLPGEVASFRFELLDDNAVNGPGRAVSPTFELRFPSLAELYDQIDRRQGGVQDALEKVADHAREMQKSLDKLSRQQPQQQSSSPQSASTFERSEEIKSALERQQQMSQRIDQASQQLRESLEQAAERRAFSEELTRKLRELADLTEQIQSKELRDAMRRMQEALEKLDPSRLDRNLQDLQQANQKLLANLERSIELLKRLREEERIDSLAKRAEELSQRQDALNQERAAADTPRDSKEAERRDQAQAERQERAADQSDRLSQDVQQQSQEAPDAGRQEALEESADQLAQQAAPSQRDAAQSDRASRRGRAKQSGQRAGESLKSVAARLRQIAEQLQKEREGADLAAIRNAAQDLVSLQRGTEEHLDAPPHAADRADRLTDLSEGVARVADSLFTLARQTPFITPQLSEALGRAIQNLGESGRQLGQGNRMRGEESGQRGAQALNEAVLELRKAESSMCNSPREGNGGKGGDNAQRLGELGQKQTQLNRETQSVARRLSQQLRLSAGDQQELERLAQEQQRIREQLEQIQRDEEREQKLLGKLDAVQRDMKEAEETIRRGPTGGDLEQKQQRILSRLLDAQRSLNRRDFDPRRESRPGEDIARRSPAELPREMLRGSDRLRLDLLKAEADRYPAQYRAFIEAYLRSLNETPR